MAGNPARVQDLHELARIWTRRRLRVLESPGWETYGRSSTITFDALGVHHTGSGHDLDDLLRRGRPLEGIPGPLCNIALHARSALSGFIGEVVLMASGRANHFGVATWSSSRALGVEATGPPFTNYLAYVQLAAGFCEWKGQPPDKVLLASPAIDVYLVAAHKEVAQPYGRKPDPSGSGWHEGGRTIAGVTLVDQFRTDVRAALRIPVPEEDDFVDKQTFFAWLNEWATTPEGQKALTLAGTKQLPKSVLQSDSVGSGVNDIQNKVNQILGRLPAAPV